LAEWRVLRPCGEGTWEAEERLTGAPGEIRVVEVGSSPSALFAQVAARGPGLHPLLVPLLDVAWLGGSRAWVVRERVELRPLDPSSGIGPPEDWLALAAALEALHQRGQAHGALAAHLGRDALGRLRLKIPWPVADHRADPLTDHRALLDLMLAGRSRPLPGPLQQLSDDLAARSRARAGDLEGWVAGVLNALSAGDPGPSVDRARSPALPDPAPSLTPLDLEPTLRAVKPAAAAPAAPLWGVVLLAPLLFAPAFALAGLLLLGGVGYLRWAPEAGREVQAVHQPDRGAWLRSHPAGAEVWEGATLLGRTPLQLSVGQPVELTVRAAGHWDRALRLRPGEEIVVELQPRGGLPP
jgi:hypothetical protein